MNKFEKALSARAEAKKPKGATLVDWYQEMPKKFFFVCVIS